MTAVAEMFGWVWQGSVSATVLVALGLLVMVCFGKVLPVWARYAIWLLVLGRLLMPGAPPASFSVWNLGRAQENERAPVVVVAPAGYKPAIQQTESLRHADSRPFPVIPLVWFVGVVGSIGLAVLRHRQLARWVGRQSLCTDARVLALVERARTAFGVRGNVAVICNEPFDVPAVFGAWRPRVLLPSSWLKEASDQEVFLVLLHEMAHVKCRDALLNWVCIFARCLHWFNPAVWYAFRRLRCEREVFCDALVLARLRPEQRPIYGNTLIKIAAHLSGAAQPATLVPILQHKPEIHRRIHMIAKYKSTSWMLSAGVALLMAVFVGLTFTRAADKKTPEPAAAKPPPKPQITAVEVLEQEVTKQHDLVRKLQSESDRQRERLSGLDSIDPGNPGRGDVLQKLQGRRIEAHAEFTRLSALYRHLTNQTRSELRRSISTASPDPQLAQLMAQQDMAEQKLADLLEALDSGHPDVKRITRVLAQINRQIENRIDGVISGLKVRLAAEEAQVETLDLELERAIHKFRESIKRSRPYQEALQELQAQEEILQRLRMRLIQEQVDRAIERGVR